jgi:hypothetical protein
MTKTVYARLAGRITVDPKTNCWVCSGWNTGNGYAKLRVNGRCRVAHKALYEEMVGAVPAKLLLDHRCRHSSCVNPAHLEPVTPRENTLRGDAKLFTKAN